MDKYYRPGDQINNYIIKKIIGQGKYGIVYLAENDVSQKVIIKQLKKDMLEKTKGKLFYEVEILNKLNKLNTPTFPQMIENMHFQEVPIYILEFIEGIVFEDLLRKYNCKFTKTEIYEVAGKILDIIELLQENNVVHRDIRPPNLILKDDKEIALIDFGLARYIDTKGHKKDIDYWYMGDFLIHLYYTSYFKKNEEDEEEKPWYEELNISQQEERFLKKLMGIEDSYDNIEEIRCDLNELKELK